MAEGRHVLPDGPPLALDAGAADKLIAAGNGDVQVDVMGYADASRPESGENASAHFRRHPSV